MSGTHTPNTPLPRPVLFPPSCTSTPHAHHLPPACSASFNTSHRAGLWRVHLSGLSVTFTFMFERYLQRI